jgi:hypothetical protein
MQKTLAVGAFLLSTSALGFDCNSDCGAAARFKYPCPTFGNPGRMCRGTEPVEYAACESVKAASCKLWNGAVGAVGHKIRPYLESRFNAGTWAQAQANGGETDYMASCVAAGVSACTLAGTELGGPWGAAMSGAIGTFVSFRVCEQSRSW